ncbi:hypothetical protein PUNSTDRAFT_19677, partial [Punctularia strigosozonata HHB-11173 SS5]|uniref:uncharacterized protein n=1 Tax=Punctularia strigosozonata (strain HHB-11173) TaxID=741275 RepID=UPI00044162C6
AIYIGPTVLLGWIIAICGCEFRVHTFRALGRMFTYELSITEKHQLVTWGPYSVVRHPSYTGMYVNIAGALTCMLSPGSWLRQCDVSESPVTMVVWVLVGLWIAYWSWMIQVFVKRAIQEDAMMRENFGKQWDEWSGRVKYRLVPGV